ncbi:MAG TPA: Uma2 family endonuclease [Pyrinomonadaceae bacterium]|nr:Uma2 family endonuclease [Pyrinomonadaceae bacterium]
MATNPETLLTEDEYLAFERRSELRHEYLAGEVFDMTGASRKHNRIVTNIVVALDTQLRDRPCNVYANDMRVRVRRARHYAYPDVVVTCGEEKFADAELDTLLNPLVIFEVMSDSTEAYDRGKKFESYQNVESLTDYLLVSQHARRVEQFTRGGGRDWVYTEAHEPGDAIGIRSIGCELRLEDVYLKVEQPTARE